MILEHIGLKEINGSLVVLDDVDNASNEEMVELHLDDGSVRAGRIVKIDGKRVVIQVFEGHARRVDGQYPHAPFRPPDGAAAFSGNPGPRV